MQSNNEAPYAVVIGGANIDIGGRSFAPLLPQESNPGSVELCLGGVGRNIAHNLALLGVQTHFITAVGADPWGDTIRSSCASLGIGSGAICTIPGGRTSSYLYIADPQGEMILALNDMEIYQHLTPALLEPHLSLLQNAGAVVLDANLPEETIAWIGAHVDVPLFADPVSAVKAPRLIPVLSKLTGLKPNRQEAELLCSRSIQSEEDGIATCKALLSTGLQRVFLSAGAEGLLAVSREAKVQLPILSTPIRSTTGCGDAAMAGIVWAHLQGLDLPHEAAAAMAAASIAAESPETVNPAMANDLLQARMQMALAVQTA